MKRFSLNFLRSLSRDYVKTVFSRAANVGKNVQSYFAAFRKKRINIFSSISPHRKFPFCNLSETFSDRNYHMSAFHAELCRKNINNFIILNGSVAFVLGVEEIKQTEISPGNCIKNASTKL